MNAQDFGLGLDIFIQEKIATYLTMIVAIGTALYLNYAIRNFLAGRRIRAMNFQFNNKFKFRNMTCAIVDIGFYKTTIKNLDTGEVSSPIPNERFENEIIWMDNHVTHRRRATDNDDSGAGKRKVDKDS